MDELHIKKTLRQQGSLEAEILQEMAEALGNSGERVERALARLQEASGRIREIKGSVAKVAEGAERIRIMTRLEQEVRAYNLLRQEAVEQLRWLIIHREALGIRNHALVVEKYRIPPPMRL